MNEKPADPQPTPDADPPAPTQGRANEMRPTPLGHAHAEYRPQERRWVLGHRDPNDPRRTPLGAVHFSIRPAGPRGLDEDEPEEQAAGAPEAAGAARPRRALWLAVGTIVGAGALTAWLLL